MISSSAVEGLELGPGGVDSVRFVSCDMVTSVSSSCDKVVVASVVVLVIGVSCNVTVGNSV